MASRIVSVGVLAATAILAGCSKSDAPAPQTKAAAPIQVAPSTEAAKPAEIDPALKERLARQEAAAQMFERKVVEPPPPKAERKAAEAKAPEPAKPEPPKPEPVKAAPPPAAEPPKVAAAAPPKATPPPAAPAKTEPPRTEVASAKPSATPPAPARLITRVDPDFPREAVQAGVEKGVVRARMMLDESGAVTRVEVVEATPRRIFDRAVIRALSQWKFNEGPAGRSVEMEVEFKR